MIFLFSGFYSFCQGKGRMEEVANRMKSFVGCMCKSEDVMILRENISAMVEEISREEGVEREVTADLSTSAVGINGNLVVFERKGGKPSAIIGMTLSEVKSLCYFDSEGDFKFLSITDLDIEWKGGES